MKILLQHSGSRLFYKNTDTWVPDETEARAFSSALEAIELCERQGLSGLEIVLRPPLGNELRVPMARDSARDSQPPA
jgi:hypothetical protein